MKLRWLKAVTPLAAALLWTPVVYADTDCLHLTGNLDATSTIAASPAGPSYTYAALNSATFSTSATLTDSLQINHAASFYFFHTSSGAWSGLVTIDGGDIMGGVSGTPELVGAANLVFNASGELSSPPPTLSALTISANFTSGAIASATKIYLSLTQFGSTSTISDISDCSVVPPDLSKNGQDFDEDLISDAVFFRERTNSVVIRLSRTNTEQSLRFGSPGDRFLIGEYTGDGHPDIVAWNYRSGFWVCTPVNGSCIPYGHFILGKRNDKPVRGDFDGDGILDLALWRRSEGKIYFLDSFNGFTGPVSSTTSTSRSDILLTGSN